MSNARSGNEAHAGETPGHHLAGSKGTDRELEKGGAYGHQAELGDFPHGEGVQRFRQ